MQAVFFMKIDENNSELPDIVSIGIGMEMTSVNKPAHCCIPIASILPFVLFCFILLIVFEQSASNRI